MEMITAVSECMHMLDIPVKQPYLAVNNIMELEAWKLHLQCP